MSIYWEEGVSKKLKNRQVINSMALFGEDVDFTWLGTAGI